MEAGAHAARGRGTDAGDHSGTHTRASARPSTPREKLDSLLGFAVGEPLPSSTDPDDPIIWMRPETTGRGRAPGLSRSGIACAAVDIADRDGIDAVSMRRVAAAVGAGTMSLYRYVRNKDELHALMVDAVIPDNEFPDQPPEEWTEVLRELGRATRRLVLKHPWFPVLQAEIAAPSPTMAAGLEFMMGSIDGLGLDIDDMLEVIMTVMTFALGAAQDETVTTRAVLRSGLTTEQWQRRQGPYIQSLIDTGNYPYFARVIVDARGPHEGREAIFERSLDRLITGIAATAPQAPTVNAPADPYSIRARSSTDR